MNNEQNEQTTVKVLTKYHCFAEGFYWALIIRLICAGVLLLVLGYILGSIYG